MPNPGLKFVLDEDPTGIQKSTYRLKHPLPWPSLFTPRQHILGNAVCQMDNDFFATRWKFRSEKHRRAFLDMDLSRWSTLVCANAMDSRIQTYACFITTLFLIDDMVDEIGEVEGRKYTDTLQKEIEDGTARSNGDVAAEILSNLLDDMRHADQEKTDVLWRELVKFWKAQTEPDRGRAFALDDYLEFRFTDIGHFVSTSLARWAIGTDIPAHEKERVHEIDLNIAAQVCIVNDLFSWEKELLQASEFNSEVVNAVSIVMRQDNVDALTAQKKLSAMVQQLERKHYQFVQDFNPLSPDSQRYIQFLTTLASVNESWSRLTARYNVVNGKRQVPEVENISFRAFELTESVKSHSKQSELFKTPFLAVAGLSVLAISVLQLVNMPAIRNLL